jgi:poly-gamma-glutamate synthesis protein (capsule biosynthesis protein)
MRRALPFGTGLKPVPKLLLVLLAVCLAACQPKSRNVTLALLGDMMIGRGVDPNIDTLAYLVPELSSADLALANLESPLGYFSPAAESTYNLCAPSDRVELIVTWGLDLLSIANNHSDDCSPQGSAETIFALEQAGITPLGPGMDPVYRQVDGLQLTFLAFDDISIPLDETSAVQAIRSARLNNSLVIVSIHWGAEYQAGATGRQKSLADTLAEAGAVLIWGHHPHVLQPAEWIQNPMDPGSRQKTTLVLYSLGNALFDQGGLADTRQSALVLVSLDATGVTGIRTVPFEIDVSNSRVMQPDAETAENIRERLHLP